MRVLGLIALALASLLVGGCGESSDKGPPGSPDNPLPALPTPTPARTPPTGEAGAPGAGGSPRYQPPEPVSQTEGQRRAQARNERRRAGDAMARTDSGPVRRRQPRRPPAPSARRPCSLVSKTTAAGIMDTRVGEPIHARQGPTCIYRSADGRRQITLTVQSESYSRLAARLRARRTVTVGGRSGACGTLGGPVLHVRLATARVLTIGAPCATAARFAARALARL